MISLMTLMTCQDCEELHHPHLQNFSQDLQGGIPHHPHNSHLQDDTTVLHLLLLQGSGELHPQDLLKSEVPGIDEEMNGQTLGCVEMMVGVEPHEKEAIPQDPQGLHQNLRIQADQKVEVRSEPGDVVVHLLLHQGLQGHVQDLGHLHPKVFLVAIIRIALKVLSTEILLHFRKG
jgi:hypothetical protein